MWSKQPQHLGNMHVATVKETAQKYLVGDLVKLLVYFELLYVTVIEVETNSVPYSVTFTVKLRPT